MTLLGNLANAAARRRATTTAETGRRGIIDIGSNSIRLVVYDGPPRSPFILFNEKVMAGLGAELSGTGAIGAEAMERGLVALRRFSLLARQMEVAQLRCVATAAVRDAVNGSAFIAAARAQGCPEIELLSGRQEGEGAAYGVISSIIGADGIVGDLGGGSLELARVKDGAVHQVVSLPLGVLRLGQIRARGKNALRRQLAKSLVAGGWAIERDLPFYMVGGSWRALAKLDMQLRDVMLPVIHQHEMTPDRAAYLLRVTAHMPKASLKRVSGSRALTLADGAALLAGLVREFDSSRLIVSAYGLREGLLYQDLAEDDRAADPLLVAAKAEGEAQGRFAGHGSLIERWIAALFPDDTAAWQRIRKAACYLADVGWRANPDFRAERGLEIALHSNWVGIDIAGRAQLAQALYANFGGGVTIAPGLEALANRASLDRAVRWGLAMRLAQRLSGGVAEPLEASKLGARDGRITLSLPRRFESLYGESVQRRLRQLGNAMGLEPILEIAD